MAKINSTEKPDEVKRCNCCGEVKPHAKFNKNRTKRGGLTGECKECIKARNSNYRNNNLERERERGRNYRNNNLEQARAYDRERAMTPERRVANNVGTRRWGEKHRLERAIQRKLQRAVASGKIIKPVACSQCGETPRKLDGHHESYDKPLEVIWLCTICHARIHMEERRSSNKGI